MTFQNPGALLYFLPLGGVVILLYLLRMRRRDVRVPATFLWPERTDEVRANALFQKLRFSWLLILQLLALSLAVVAFAKPQTKQRGLAGEVTVLVIDTSASMSATDVKPSRFANAKKQAEEAIRSAGASDRIALIEAGPTPRVLFPLSSDPSKQLRALDGLKPTDAEADVGDALRLAAALVGSIDGARIVLLSDGVFDKVTNFSRGKAALVYRSIGDSDENLAISALGTAETPTGRQLYCAIKNESLKPIDGTLSLYADGKVIDSVKVPAVTPRGQWGRTISAPASAKVFEAKLDAPDILKSDNYAVSLTSAGASQHVLIVGKGDIFLERALALEPRVVLDRSANLPADTSPYDIVVFDGVEEQPVASRGVLTLGTAGPATPVTTDGSVKSPQFVSAENQALMKGVDLKGVFIDHAEKVKPRANGVVQALGDNGPLIVTSSSPTKRQVYLSFEPLQSDFPLQIAFPIFVSNVLDFLAGEADSSLLSVKTGVPFSQPTTAPATLKTPAGDTLSIKPVANTLIVRETRQIGKYELTVGGKTKSVYSTLRSDTESDLKPQKDLSLGGGEVRASTSPSRFADFWRPLCMLCLFVLGGEWWLFARRS